MRSATPQITPMVLGKKGENNESNDNRLVQGEKIVSFYDNNKKPHWFMGQGAFREFLAEHNWEISLIISMIAFCLAILSLVNKLK